MELSELLGEAYKEGMTVEDVSEALKNITLPKDQSAEIEKLKNSLTKSNSDAADWKRKYQSTLDEASRKAAEEEETTTALKDELTKLRREMTISGYKTSYISMGYSEEDAANVAEMLVDGKIDDAMAIQKKHQERMAEKIKKDLLKSTLRPDGSPEDRDDDAGAVKKAQEMAKSRAENAKRANEAMRNYMH